MGDYLTVKDIAEQLDVTVETIRRWLRTGKLKGTSLGRAGYRVHKNDFQLFMCHGSSQQHHQSSHAAQESLVRQLEAMQPFVALVENSSDVIVMASMQYHILYMNRAGYALCGVNGEEAHTQSFLTYVSANKHPFLQEILLPEVQRNGHWEGDFELLNSQTNASIDVWQSVFLILHPQTHLPICLAIIARDIHEQKELERRKDAFTSMASHELRNPLATLQANLQLAERRIKSIGQAGEQHETVQKASSDALQMLDRARHQAKVMNRLIGDLLDSTRIQANKLNLALAEHDLIPIMRDTIIDQLEITPRRIIRLAPLPTEQEIIVLSDKDRIGQVISNYLSNALKYSAATQEVAIGLTVDSEHVRVWVQDHGPGLTDEQQKHIWDRYYQAKDIVVQSGSGIGLGLGLHICKTLIGRHGGEVGVESQKGCGSTFWFQLPLANILYS